MPQLELPFLFVCVATSLDSATQKALMPEAPAQRRAVPRLRRAALVLTASGRSELEGRNSGELRGVGGFQDLNFIENPGGNREREQLL